MYFKVPIHKTISNDDQSSLSVFNSSTHNLDNIAILKVKNTITYFNS